MSQDIPQVDLQRCVQLLCLAVANLGYFMAGPSMDARTREEMAKDTEKYVSECAEILGLKEKE